MSLIERFNEVKQDYEGRKAVREAKELQKLRKKRINLEGKAKRRALKERELSRIRKAEGTLKKGKKPLFGDISLGFGEQKGKKGKSMYDELFDFGSKKKKKGGNLLDF